jgi:protein-disulfide isomerase
MTDSPRLTMPVAARDHALGPTSALVTLVEYGDFECPHCQAAYPHLRAIRERFGDRLRIVFRHFPLTNVHPHAQAAAEVSEWAAAEGQFWPMHDALYEEKTLSEPLFVRLADRLKLDGASLARSLQEHRFFARVKEDFLGAIKSGVKGTPAFFINDLRHQGDATTLAPALDRALAEGEAPSAG